MCRLFKKFGRSPAVLRVAVDYGLLMAGSALYAFGFAYFISPAKISPGGFTGIAAAVGHLTGLPTGGLLFALNLPVLVLGFKKIGGKFLVKTLVVTALTSLLIDLYGPQLPTFTGDRLLAAIFGGVVTGTGLALVMLKGATSGGVDVIAALLLRRFPTLSMGRAIMLLDGLVIIFAALCYRQAETALFAVITIFFSAGVVDSLLYGADKGRLLIIVTDRADEVAAALFGELCRGVTLIPCRGAYSGADKLTLLCALRDAEVGKGLAVLRRTDPDAFTVVAVTGGIFGRGFEKRGF